MHRLEADLLVVGGGLAGLLTALRAAPARVVLLSKARLGQGTASERAQGGIAAAMGGNDSPALHAADTRAAGGGITAPDMVEILAREAPDRMAELIGLGVAFDRDHEGRLALGREAAHSRRRILHAGGDGTGREVMRALVAAVREASHITVRDDGPVLDLLAADGRVFGAVSASGGRGLAVVAGATVLATGGIGQVYARTTNPGEATGDGLAMAARAGAILADVEFVQFHPTALDVGLDPMPLATEALRGEGAILVDAHGVRFMPSVHEGAELAPRDVVARAIWRRRRSTGKVLLDCRAAVGEAFPDRFPTVWRHCREAGLDPRREPIAIAPAAHYHMGGVAVDEHGRTSLEGLWACGEVASSGVHGANRLASNSLLEAVVFAHRVAADAARSARTPGARFSLPVALVPPGDPDAARVRHLRRTMDDFVGLVRDEAGLRHALAEITAAETRDPGMRNPVVVARLIALAALQRRESRGSHFRADHPEASERFRERTFITLAEVDDAIRALDLEPVRARRARG